MNVAFSYLAVQPEAEEKGEMGQPGDWLVCCTQIMVPDVKKNGITENTFLSLFFSIGAVAHF